MAKKVAEIFIETLVNAVTTLANIAIPSPHNNFQPNCPPDQPVFPQPARYTPGRTANL